MSKQTNPADTSAHSALPWSAFEVDGDLSIYAADGIPIAELWLTQDTKANTEFIVRACNAHDDLVKALQMAKHIVAQEGTHEQLEQVFAALEMAGVKP